jgi:hypothetical protein
MRRDDQLECEELTWKDQPHCEWLQYIDLRIALDTEACVRGHVIWVKGEVKWRDDRSWEMWKESLDWRNEVNTS